MYKMDTAVSKPKPVLKLFLTIIIVGNYCLAHYFPKAIRLCAGESSSEKKSEGTE